MVSRWSAPDGPPVTPRMVARPIRGLGRYAIHELPPAAAQALERLHEWGWRNWDREIDAVDERQAFACRFCGVIRQAWSVVGVCRGCADAGHCASLEGVHRPIRGWIVKRDGVATPRRYCGWCGINCGDPERNSWLYNVEFFDRRVTRAPEPCERCGSEDGVQLHHWAPGAIFSDSNHWPTSWLCVTCHAAWHATMRAAGGYRLEVREASPNARPGEIWEWIWGSGPEHSVSPETPARST